MKRFKEKIVKAYDNIVACLATEVPVKRYEIGATVAVVIALAANLA